jgi:hypothetical protein
MKFFLSESDTHPENTRFSFSLISIGHRCPSRLKSDRHGGSGGSTDLNISGIGE